MPTDEASITRSVSGRSTHRAVHLFVPCRIVTQIPSTAVAEETIIREFRKETSGRSWSCRCVPGNPFSDHCNGSWATTCLFRLHPDWKEDQADEVRSACTNEERTCSSR